jgi:hypothetical protein
MIQRNSKCEVKGSKKQTIKYSIALVAHMSTPVIRWFATVLVFSRN